MQPLIIKQSRDQQLRAAATTGAGIILLLVCMLVTHAPAPAFAFVALIALWAGYVGYRWFTLSFEASGQELVIHSFVNVRRVPVSQVRGVGIVKGYGRYRYQMVLDTTRGGIPVYVLSVPRNLSKSNTELAWQELERRRIEIERWLAEARSIGSMTGDPSGSSVPYTGRSDAT